LIAVEPPTGTRWAELASRIDALSMSYRTSKLGGTEMAVQGGSIVPVERIEQQILLIRGDKVMLDEDLAKLYGVPTRQLNEAVHRNLDRFPDDFMFQLSAEEYESLRSQIATSKGRGGRRYRPYAFTEQGVAMLSSVLKSRRAVQVNVQIMRTFVRLRQLLSSNAALAKRLNELEKRYDANFRAVFDAIRDLMEVDDERKQRPRIGYHAERTT
jgi:hypothetical protein